MPLVTRQVNQSNVYRQSTEPTDTWVNGDLWVDTDDGVVHVNIEGTASKVSRSIAELLIFG